MGTLGMYIDTEQLRRDGQNCNLNFDELIVDAKAKREAAKQGGKA